MSQVTLCLALASVAAALPQGAYKEVKEIPKPYTYQYAVADDYSKANFQKSESQDSNVSVTYPKKNFLRISMNFFFKGNVKGQFVIALPDGRIQTTSYTADHVQGFIADVSYQGEPVYPEARPYKPSI